MCYFQVIQTEVCSIKFSWPVSEIDIEIMWRHIFLALRKLLCLGAWQLPCTECISKLWFIDAYYIAFWFHPTFWNGGNREKGGIFLFLMCTIEVWNYVFLIFFSRKRELKKSNIKVRLNTKNVNQTFKQKKTWCICDVICK